LDINKEKCPKCGSLNTYMWDELDSVSWDDDYTCTCYQCDDCGFIFDWVTGDPPFCEYYLDNVFDGGVVPEV